MGLIKGNFTFSRYRVVGQIPDGFSDFIDSRIKLFAFKSSSSPEEKLMGWTSLENVLDTNFEYANYRLADYIVFALRIDTRKVPPSLLKLRALEAEKIFMEEKNKKKIYREQKKEIREAVRAKLLSEIPPTPSFYEICWSASKGWLVFGSIAKNVAEDFEGFFERSFKLKLVPSVPWNVVDSENEIASAAGKSGYGVSEEDNR